MYREIHHKNTLFEFFQPSAEALASLILHEVNCDQCESVRKVFVCSAQYIAAHMQEEQEVFWEYVVLKNK